MGSIWNNDYVQLVAIYFILYLETIICKRKQNECVITENALQIVWVCAHLGRLTLVSENMHASTKLI